MRTVDLLFFMGQSNMAGRGAAALAPVVAPGMGYEYRAVTDPDTLHPLEEPFGVNENDPAGAVSYTHLDVYKRQLLKMS